MKNTLELNDELDDEEIASFALAALEHYPTPPLERTSAAAASSENEEFETDVLSWLEASLPKQTAPAIRSQSAPPQSAGLAEPGTFRIARKFRHEGMAFELKLYYIQSRCYRDLLSDLINMALKRFDRKDRYVSFVFLKDTDQIEIPEWIKAKITRTLNCERSVRTELWPLTLNNEITVSNCADEDHTHALLTTLASLRQRCEPIRFTSPQRSASTPALLYTYETATEYEPYIPGGFDNSVEVPLSGLGEWDPEFDPRNVFLPKP